VIGIIAALPAEARTVSDRSGTGARRVLVSGVGAVAAGRAAAALLAAGATGLVSWGTAAGLGDDVASGTIIVATGVVASSASTARRSRDDGAWADRLAAVLAARIASPDGAPAPLVRRGLIADPAGVLRTPAEKRRLAATAGAVIADMETAAIADAATAAGRPWLAIRAVADGVDVGLPRSVLRAIDDEGRMRYGRLAQELLGHPGDALALPAIARGFRLALRALRMVADAGGPSLAFAAATTSAPASAGPRTRVAPLATEVGIGGSAGGGA
jgi:adenosylhomocysteine nucleosidase